MPDQLTIGQSATRDRGKGQSESVGIVTLASVEAERLFIEVAKQMKRFDAHIGSLKATLQETPEVLNGVGVDVPTHVFNGVIDHLMGILALQTSVRPPRIREQRRAWLNMATNLSMQTEARGIGQDLCANLAVSGDGAALQHAHDDRFPRPTGPLDLLPAFISMHVPSKTADEGFVSLNGSPKLLKRAGLCGQSEPVQHEPGGFLSDAKSASDFVGANPVLAIDHHPHSGEPLGQRDGAIFHDGADLDGKLLLQMLPATLPHLGIRHKRDFPRLTAWTDDLAVLPTDGRHERQGASRISEVLDSLKQGLGVSLCFHDPILAR